MNQTTANHLISPRSPHVSCTNRRGSRAALLSAMIAGVLCFLPAPASAESHGDDGFSLGLILGDPSGLTLRGGIGGPNAIQAHFGFSPLPGDALAVMVDWTYDAWDFLADNKTAGLKFFFGVGGKGEWFTGKYFIYKHDKHLVAYDDSYFGLGLRGVVGLRAPFRKAPFDLFFELAPVGVTFVVPDGGVYYDFDAAIGFRYRF